MKIYIEELEFECIIGILEHERKNSQRVIISANLEYKYSSGVFVNYTQVSDLITKSMKDGKFELLEDAVEKLSEKIHKKFSVVTKLYLKISKPDIMKNSKVSLSENYTFL